MALPRWIGRLFRVDLKKVAEQEETRVERLRAQRDAEVERAKAEAEIAFKAPKD